MKLSPELLSVLRRTLLGTAIAITLIALFVTEENWRGDRAWAGVERDLKARGELRSETAALSPPIPDEQNFFKTPLLNRLLYNRPDDIERKKFLVETRFREFRVLHNQLISSRDFSAIRSLLRKRGFFTAPDSSSPVLDLLLTLEPLRPLLDEVRDAASSRPQAALQLEFSPSSPFASSVDLNFAIGLGVILATRADLELELGKITEAHADVVALLRLGDGLAAPSESATFMSLRAGISAYENAAPIIARGRERHLWNESQLAAIERLLGQLRPLPTVQAARRYERALFISLVDAGPRWDPENFQWPFWFFHGLAQQNKVAYSRAIDRDLLSAITFAPDRILSRPPKLRLATQSWLSPDGTVARLRHPYSWLSEMAFLDLDRILQDLGYSIDRLALLRISCAFERHRLAVGAFPEKLDDLVPRFLPAIPTGIFDGQSLQLRKTPEGGSEIYFFGRDGRDNQGTGDDPVLKISPVSGSGSH